MTNTIKRENFETYRQIVENKPEDYFYKITSTAKAKHGELRFRFSNSDYIIEYNYNELTILESPKAVNIIEKLINLQKYRDNGINKNLFGKDEIKNYNNDIVEKENKISALTEQVNRFIIGNENQ